MKHLPNIAGALLGFLFVAFGLMFLLGLVPAQPAPPEGSPMAMFMGAMAPTGYLTFVKVFEVLGGLLVAIPKFRNFGLLILCPVIINILAFHIFILKCAMILDPILITICVFAVYLLWTKRATLKSLLN